VCGAVCVCVCVCVVCVPRPMGRVSCASRQRAASTACSRGSRARSRRCGTNCWRWPSTCLTR
jgi:hypothetical protein